MTKPPYQLKDVRDYLTLQPFQAVAVDESGAISPMGFDGSTYFVVFACLRTLYHDVFTMCTRDEFPVVLDIYLNRIRQRGFRVQAMHLRLDCAGEHVGRQENMAHDVYKKYSVEPCFTIPPYHHENPAEIAVKEFSF